MVYPRGMKKGNGINILKMGRIGEKAKLLSTIYSPRILNNRNQLDFFSAPQLERGRVPGHGGF